MIRSMKVIIALGLVGLFAATAQAGEVQKPTTALEALLKRPTTQVLWSVEVAAIASVDSLAVLTALKLKDPAEPGAIAMGFRLDLFRPGAPRRELYLGGGIESRMFTIGLRGLDRVRAPDSASGGASYSE